MRPDLRWRPHRVDGGGDRRLFSARHVFLSSDPHVGEGYQLTGATTLYPLTAPALVVIGFMMMRSAAKIDWDDLHEALPAFMMLLMIPFTLSIPDGFTFGFLAYSLLSLVSGRIRQSDPLLHVISFLLLLRWIFC
ncbi:MAG: hypothetical protein ABIF77_02430 [bacterium]